MMFVEPLVFHSATRGSQNGLLLVTGLHYAPFGIRLQSAVRPLLDNRLDGGSLDTPLDEP